jgi:hypothetical protein
MPASAVAEPRVEIQTPPEIRALQLAELEKAAAKYGFDPLPNELPQELEPEPAVTVLRRHLAHLRLRGSVLDPGFRPKPHLGEFMLLDGVPLVVDVLDRYAPLQGCILCSGPKGESYTICAGCWTTQSRFSEQMMLDVLPDVDESELTGFKPLTPEQFRRAIRRAPRLEPRRHGALQPGLEAIRRKARAAVAMADSAARLDALRAAVAEPGITPRQRRVRVRQLRAAEAAAPWSARDWFHKKASYSLDDVWLAVLATGEADADEHEEDDDDYPVEWLEEDWMTAPDRVTFVGELDHAVIPHSNTAAGGDEHLEALYRNALYDSYRSARARSYFQDGLDEYITWLAAELIARGGIPTRLRARSPEEWDDDECERWDRWIDAVLGGTPAPAPAGVEPIDAALCRRWGARATTDADGNTAPVHLPKLGSDFPSGRIRWPHFIAEEIEAQHHAWGRWVELPEEDGSIIRVWTGEGPDERYRRVRPDKLAEIQLRRLKDWARSGVKPIACTRVERGRRPDGTSAAWSRDLRREWEREIRADRRRRRFEAIADANARIHPTHLEYGRFQTSFHSN